MKLHILIGTVTGTAQRVAQAIQLDCADLLRAIEVTLMDRLDIGVFDPAPNTNTLYLICTSTYGAGDVPDNAQGLYQSLDQTPRYLGHVRYGVLALGDLANHGATFCRAGSLFDERLLDLGAQRLGDLWCHDASDSADPESAAVAWCRAWLQAAQAPHS